MAANITARLYELQDKQYAEFQSKLIPTVARDTIIGIRVPILRNFSKEIKGSETASSFLSQLPHQFYDENMLHAILVSEINRKDDYDRCIELVDTFLPYVDNWAVCDILSPKVFKKNRHLLIGKDGKTLIDKIYEWSASDKPYTCRFGMEMLMTHYLDEDYREKYLEIPASVHSEEYYVNMMVAWFYATALAKQWNDSITYLENNRLDIWTHNKTIQKACESYRITAEQKKYLRTLKRTPKIK